MVAEKGLKAVAQARDGDDVGRTGAKSKARAGLGFSAATPPAKRAKTETVEERPALESKPAPAPRFENANTVFVKHLPLDITTDRIRDEIFSGLQVRCSQFVPADISHRSN